jgi:hypothetical protein
VTATRKLPSKLTSGLGPIEYTKAEGEVSLIHSCGELAPWQGHRKVTGGTDGELEIVDVKPAAGSNELAVVFNPAGDMMNEMPLESVEGQNAGCGEPAVANSGQMGLWWASFYYAHVQELQQTSGDFEVTGLKYDASKGAYTKNYERSVVRQGNAGYSYQEATRIEVEPEWCAGTQNQIVSATANGQSIGLGERFYQGQVVTAPPGTRIVLGDESVMELADGGKFWIDECDTSFTGVFLKDSVKSFWTHVKKIAAGSEKKFEVQTERAVAGVRGTIFEISYDKTRQLTKLATEEGSVWFKSRNGAKKGRVIVDAGESATQKGKGKPVLKK